MAEKSRDSKWALQHANVPKLGWLEIQGDSQIRESKGLWAQTDNILEDNGYIPSFLLFLVLQVLLFVLAGREQAGWTGDVPSPGFDESETRSLLQANSYFSRDLLAERDMATVLLPEKLNWKNTLRKGRMQTRLSSSQTKLHQVTSCDIHAYPWCLCWKLEMSQSQLYFECRANRSHFLRIWWIWKQGAYYKPIHTSAVTPLQDRNMAVVLPEKFI
jgi:hypothetical protein